MFTVTNCQKGRKFGQSGHTGRMSVVKPVFHREKVNRLGEISPLLATRNGKNFNTNILIKSKIKYKVSICLNNLLTSAPTKIGIL